MTRFWEARLFSKAIAAAGSVELRVFSSAVGSGGLEAATTSTIAVQDMLRGQRRSQ